MTCKDCVHCGLCKYRSTLMIEDSCLAEQCDYFKDNSLFIKLPCKIGDKYYKIQQQCTERGYYDKFTDTDIMDCESYCDRDGKCDRRYYIKEYKFNSLSQIVSYYEEYILDNRFEQCRRIFHDKEEAERVLKERYTHEN